jgi:hypothetical protein
LPPVPAIKNIAPFGSLYTELPLSVIIGDELFDRSMKLEMIADNCGYELAELRPHRTCQRVGGIHFHKGAQTNRTGFVCDFRMTSLNSYHVRKLLLN